ncbi:MAG: diacylglycerol kinase family protein [Thermodesulfobacteriota bacterium]
MRARAARAAPRGEPAIAALPVTSTRATGAPSGSVGARRWHEIDVLLNAGSGGRDEEQARQALVELLHARDPRANVHLVRGAELAGLARDVASGGGLVVAAGGDGTVATVASALLGTGSTLGVVPLGTFNYFARDLGIPSELDAAVAVLFEGEVVPTAAGEVNGRIFLNNASVGIYPTVLREREKAYERLGLRSRVLAYVVTLIATLRRWRSLRLFLTIDGRQLVRRTELLFVACNRYQIEALELKGIGCLESGRFSIYLTPGAGRLALLKLSLKALLGGLRDAEELDVLCGREVVVHIRQRRVPVGADGEVVVTDTPLRFRLLPDALQVVAPARA